jgi:hypothetical protein
MKHCFKCQTEKPFTEFYKHSGMVDGYLNKCKDCAKRDAIQHRLENIEKIREYDRVRGKLPERAAKADVISSAWRKADSRRIKCHNAVARAVKKGTLIKVPCERCGNIKSLAHHDDYDKPLDVMWLCQPCHKQRHKELDLI